MDCITPWVPAIALHTGPTLVILTMATTITGIQPDMAVNTRIAETSDTEAGRDDGAVITEAMMVRGEGVEEAIMVVLVEVAEAAVETEVEAVAEAAVEVAVGVAVGEVGRAVIADRQYSRH